MDDGRHDRDARKREQGEGEVRGHDGQRLRMNHSERPHNGFPHDQAEADGREDPGPQNAIPFQAKMVTGTTRMPSMLVTARCPYSTHG